MEEIEKKSNLLLKSLNMRCQFVNKSNEFIVDKFYLDHVYCNGYRSFGKINASMHDIINCIWNIYGNENNIKECDDNICHYKLVNEIDDDTRICYQINNIMWPYWKRDMLYLQKKIIQDNVSYILMYSVEMNNITTSDKIVRAYLYVGGYVAFPSIDGTHIYKMIAVDFGKNIPYFISSSNIYYRIMDIVKNKLSN